MSKLLVLGTGPLLEPGVGLFGAHGLRTSHLTRPLIAAGHEVMLFTVPMHDPDDPKQQHAGIEDRQFDGYPYTAFTNGDERHNLRRLQEAVGTFVPDAMIGVNTYPSALLSGLNCRAPLWADLNGSATMEGQAKARNDRSDALLGHSWKMERASLRRADMFSVVSRRQMYLLCGQLSAVGRMNQHTFNYAFAEVIPNAYNPLFTDAESKKPGSMIRGERIPDDAFVLLWSGGYNAWTDFSVLERALVMAMEACPNLYFVSTGGAVAGHDDLSYARFVEAVARTTYAERFCFLGWIDAGEVPKVMAQADLGLQLDSRNFETLFGARNRTINMMAGGLPVITTAGAEISDELIAAGCVESCRPGSAEDLARKIVMLSRDRSRLKDLAMRGRAHVLEYYSYERTTIGLVDWAMAPEIAPDNCVKLEKAAPEKYPYALALNPIEEEQALLDRIDAVGLEGALQDPDDLFRSPLQKLTRRVIGATFYDRLRAVRRKLRE